MLTVMAISWLRMLKKLMRRFQTFFSNVQAKDDTSSLHPNYRLPLTSPMAGELRTNDDILKYLPLRY